MYIHTYTCIYFGRQNCRRKFVFIYIQNTLIYLHLHAYTFIYIHISTDVFCMYMVMYMVMYMYVYRLYIVCICTYTRICTYFLHGKLLVGSIRAYTCIYGYTYKMHRIYRSYTSHIHTNTYNIHTICLEPVFFVYVYWCPYKHVYVVY